MPGCSAFGCSNSSVKGFLMKRFPRDPERRKLWAVKVKRNNWIPTDASCLCEAHFTTDMFERNRADGKRMLKRFAVPTIFGHVPDIKTKEPPKKRASPKKEKIPTPEMLVPPFELSSSTTVDEAVIMHSDFGSTASSESLSPAPTLQPRMKWKELKERITTFNKKMDDEDTDMDTHMCLRCHEMIVGLSNYVLHKRQSCPAYHVVKDPNQNTVKQTTASIDTSGTASSCNSSMTDDGKQKRRPDDFFFSLGLEMQPKILNKGKEFLNLRKSKRRKCSLSVIKSAPIVSNTDDSDDDDTDDYRPPKGYTGAKWKPGSIPKSLSVHGRSDSEIILNDMNHVTVECLSSTTAVGNFESEFEKSERPSSNFQCSCNFSTNIEDLLVKHLMDPSHWKSLKSHPEHEALVLRYASLMASNAPFRCDICKFYFNQSQYLIDHWITDWELHSMPQAKYGFQCSLCATHFKTAKSVLKHLNSNIHVDNVSCKTPLRISALSKLGYPCLDCVYVARSSKALELHIKRNHLSSSPKLIDDGVASRRRECRFCNEHFSCLAILKEHVNKVHPNSLFSCSACSLTFYSKAQHYKHFKGHQNPKPKLKGTGDVKNAFLCKSCDFSCEIKAELLYHETLHTDAFIKMDGDGDTIKKPMKQYMCPACKQLVLKRSLLGHLIEHTGEKPFNCNDCKATFTSKNSLYQHVKSLHSGKNISCPHCEFKTFSKFRLTRHLTTHEISRPRPHLCEICGADFLESYALRYHMKLHVGDKHHKCSFEGCERSYRSASELIIHVRTHTDERPFLCTECGYAAKTRHQLTKHERKHNGHRPFKCPHCPYAAKLSAQLWRHVRTHTGARPYSCPHCDYTCNTSENLRKHVLKSKKHKGLNIYICPHCSDFGCNHLKEFHEHIVSQHKDKINVNEPVTPTYLSLLAGVYDKNVSQSEPKINLVESTGHIDGPDHVTSQDSDVTIVNANDVKLNDNLTVIKLEGDFEFRNTDDFKLKIGDNYEFAKVDNFEPESVTPHDEVTMVSIELVQHDEETVVTSEHLPGPSSPIEAVLVDEDGVSNSDTNTILIYLPIK